MSQLKVNSIVPVGGLPSGSNGGIIQCKQTFKSDTTSIANTTSRADISGMSVTITPSSNANKILIISSLVIGLPAGEYPFACYLMRGSTDIGKGTTASGSRVNITMGMMSDDSSDHAYPPMCFHFIDSPATTSATTYKWQWQHPRHSDRTAYLNRPVQDNDENYNLRASSTITAFEITT